MKLSQVEPASDADMPLGTSAACGLAAGVAALILSINPDLTAAEVRQTLEQSADKIIDLQPDPQLGLSLPGYIDRHSAWFGYGKINAIQALQLAQRQAQPFRLPTRWLQYACSIQSTIPDGDPQGLLSPLQIDKSDPIRDIEVIVEIEHEFLGDLELHLIPPWGSSIPLQSRSGGRQTSLKTTYSLDNAIWLKTALNRPAHGQWQLQIIDAVPEKRGVLQKWQLNLGL
jgi:subtilisin-like proprotein convertase family protein